MRIKKRAFKKRRLADINTLLVCLLFFGVSLGLVAQKSALSNGISQKTMSLPDFLAYIHPLVQAHGVGKIGRAIHAFAADKFEQVLTKIIEHEDWPLTRNDKLLLLLSLAAQYKDDLYQQDKILNFIFEYSDLFSQGDPLLYVLAYQEAYEKDILKQEIPILLHWVQRVKGAQPFIAHAVSKALLYTVEKDDLDTLRRMIAHGVPVTKELATQMVWKVVEEQKNPGFIDELEKVGANFNKQKGSYTPLLKAILARDKPMIQHLLQAGADPNLLVNNEVGTPLQLILSEGMRAKEEGRMADVVRYTELDDMLRRFGAREQYVH